MELDREYFLRMMKGRSAGAVVVEGSEGGGGGGGATLGPLLASLNAVAMPTAEGYLHWTGSAWEFPSIDLSSYATKQWVLQQGYITSSAISDMATKTWVGQQGFATTSQLSHYLALTGGTMEDSIITPGSDSYGIYPETDRYGFIGKSTNWYWNIYGSRLYAEKMELYIYSSGSRSLYGGIDNNNFYLYPGTNSYKFNVDSNGYVTAQKFVKDGGTSSQFLKADGTVDTNTYLTSVPSSYVSVDNDGIFSHQIITDNQVHLYGGNGHLYGSIVIGDNNGGVVDSISTNSLGQLTWGSDSVVMSSDISDMATETWVGQQNFSHGHSVHGGLTSGHLVVRDNDFSRWDMPFTFDPDDGGTVIPAFLPLSGGILSSTLEIDTGGDRKLVLNNTDNEQWNIISFQDNGTEVGYLGLCGSNALAWNQHEVLLAGYDNNLINHGNEFTFVSAGYGSDVSEFPNGRMVWFNYRTASGNLDGNISSYKFGDGKGGELAEITNGQFSGNAASANYAGALKDNGNTKVAATSVGATVTGVLRSTAGFTVDNSSYNISVKQSLDVGDSWPVYNIQFLDTGTATANVCTFAFNGDVKTTRGLNGALLRLDYKDSTYQNNDFYLKQTIAPNGYVRQCTFAPFLSSDDSDISSTFGFRFEGTVAADNISNNSDIRLKNIVSHADFEVDKLATLPLVWFTWKKDERRRMHFGSIAQEWQKVLPEVVSENGDGMLAMDYGAAAMAAGVTACRKAVELERRIVELEEIINQLKQ